MRCTILNKPNAIYIQNRQANNRLVKQESKKTIGKRITITSSNRKTSGAYLSCRPIFQNSSSFWYSSLRLLHHQCQHLRHQKVQEGFVGSRNYLNEIKATSDKMELSIKPVEICIL